MLYYPGQARKFVSLSSARSNIGFLLMELEIYDMQIALSSLYLSARQSALRLCREGVFLET